MCMCVLNEAADGIGVAEENVAGIFVLDRAGHIHMRLRDGTPRDWAAEGLRAALDALPNYASKTTK